MKYLELPTSEEAIAREKQASIDYGLGSGETVHVWQVTDNKVYVSEDTMHLLTEVEIESLKEEVEEDEET